MLHKLLERILQTDPDRVLLEFHEQQWSAAELEESSKRLTSGLIQLGLQPIDRVAVLLVASGVPVGGLSKGLPLFGAGFLPMCLPAGVLAEV